MGDGQGLLLSWKRNQYRPGDRRLPGHRVLEVHPNTALSRIQPRTAQKGPMVPVTEAPWTEAKEAQFHSEKGSQAWGSCARPRGLRSSGLPAEPQGITALAGHRQENRAVPPQQVTSVSRPDTQVP